MTSEHRGAPSAAHVDPPRRVRLRYAQTAFVALGFAFLAALPFAWAAAPWGLLVLVVLLFAGYLLRRVGAEITPEEVVIRGAFYQRRVPREQIVGLDVPDGRHVYLARTSGTAIALPTARPRDLPRLRALLFGIPMDPDDEIDAEAAHTRRGLGESPADESAVR